MPRRGRRKANKHRRAIADTSSRRECQALGGVNGMMALAVRGNRGVTSVPANAALPTLHCRQPGESALRQPPLENQPGADAVDAAGAPGVEVAAAAAALRQDFSPRLKAGQPLIPKHDR